MRPGARSGPGSGARTRIISPGTPAPTRTSATPVSSAVIHIIVLFHQRVKESKTRLK